MESVIVSSKKSPIPNAPESTLKKVSSKCISSFGEHADILNVCIANENPTTMNTKNSIKLGIFFTMIFETTKAKMLASLLITPKNARFVIQPSKRTIPVTSTYDS